MSLVCCLSIKCSFLRNIARSVPFFHHIARFYTITTLQKHNYRTAVISLPRCGYIVTTQREQRYRGVIALFVLYVIISLQIYNNKYKRQNVWLTNQTAIKQKTTKEKNGWQIDINELPTVFWVLIFEFWILSFELSATPIRNFSILN